MTDILQANIFFFIASLGTVIFIVLLSVVLFQVIVILKKVQIVIDRVERESQNLSNDIAAARAFVAEKSLMMSPLLALLGLRKATSAAKKSRTARKSAKNEE